MGTNGSTFVVILEIQGDYRALTAVHCNMLLLWLHNDCLDNPVKYTTILICYHNIPGTWHCLATTGCDSGCQLWAGI